MESCLADSCAAALQQGTPTLIFTQLLQTLLIAQCSLSSPNTYPPDRTPEILSSSAPTEYDFIVVGGGSAGSVVASRLSEIENWRVLLVEAGDDPSVLSEIPALLLKLQGTDEDFGYETEPHPGFCLGMKEGNCKWAKGKVLGGSSAINAMLVIHGSDDDFDTWSKAGNEGWSYSEVLPYFKKALSYPEELVRKHPQYFSADGPLSVRAYNYSDTTIQDVVMAGAREVGVPSLENFNAGEYIGFARAYGTLDNGRRVNVARAYLGGQTASRKNLHVLKKARVDKIEMTDGIRATGVKVTLRDGTAVSLKAKKEVILSAGSIATPQLLMLSGVGPRDHLEELGLPVLVDLPVGKNLQDHVVWLGLHLVYENVTQKAEPLPTFFLDAAYEYLTRRSGLFASSGSIDLLGFVKLNEEGDDKYPDIEFHHTHVPQGELFKMEGVADAFGVKDEIAREMYKVALESDILFMAPVLLRPKSIGELKLANDDPAVPIKIYANYFQEREDVEIMLKTVDFVKSLLKTESFKKLGIRLRHFPIDNCSRMEPDSKEYWECNLRHISATVYHPVGTTRMGPKGDPRAVVDSKLRVHGVQALRVIDASIMPNITRGNTNAPTIMIAEKGADLIRQDWLVKDEL